MKQNIVAKKYEQIKGAWGWSSILKITTENHGDKYYKENYLKPPAECFIIQLLYQKWKDNLPKMIATDSISNWSIMDDFGDETLILHSAETWQRAVMLYADMQLYSYSILKAVESSNCTVMSTVNILSKMNSIVQCYSDWANAEEIDIVKIYEFAKKECCKLDAINTIPLALHNEDFRLGNVGVNNGNVIIYDWSNTVIAHPFFSIHYFLRRIDKAFIERKEVLLATYLQRWHAFGDDDCLRNIYSRIDSLLHVYELVRCFSDLPYQEEETPWNKNTQRYIKRCLKNLAIQMESNG